MLLVVLVLAVVLAGTWASGAFRSDGPARVAGPAAPAPAPSSPVPVFTDPPAEPVPASAALAATAWTQAFCVRPGTAREAWLARLAPLTDPEYLGQLRTESDPGSAPEQVVGPAVGVSAAAGSAVVDVPTDRGTLRITLVTDDSGGAWLVSDADPAGAGR